MFSRLSVRSVRVAVGLVLLATFLLGACARVGEDPPAPDEHGLEKTQCLTDAARVMGQFVQGDAKTDEVTGAWNCFGGAFEAFYKYVRGESRESYTPQELATYFENNFFEKESDKKHIPVGLQTEFMKIKQIFVGGSREIITREEVLAVTQIARSLGKIAQTVNPYMKVYLMKWTTKKDRLEEDQAYFESANVTIQEGATQLSALIQKKHDPYQIDDIANFLDQIGKFLDVKWSVVEEMRQFMPVARKVKHALAGGEEGQIVATEWRRIFLLGSRAYIQYLRYHYFIEKELQPPSGGSNRPFPMDYVARAFEDTFSIFEDMVREKPTGIVSRAELVEICDALSKAWSKFKYSEDFLTEVMKIKQALVGGTTEAFAASDFQNARLKVSTVKIIIGRLLPFLDVYLGEWKANSLPYREGLAHFNDARSAFDQSLTELGGVLESTYNIRFFSKFIGEFEELYPPAPNQSVSAAFAKALPFVVQLKNLLYNDDDSVLKKQQWPSFLGYVSRLFGTYRFYGYFLQGKSDVRLETYDAMSQTTNQVIGHLLNLMKIRGRDIITTTEVKQFIFELQDVGVISKEIESETIDRVSKVILNRILNAPDRRLAGDMPNGIRPNTLVYVQQELQGWIQTQSFLIEVMAKSKNGRTVSPSSVRKLIAAQLADPKITKELKEALGGLNIAIGGDLPFALDRGGRLLISRRLDPELNLPSLQRHNFIRAITRIFLASYTESASRVRRNIYASEAERAFRELKSIAIDYGILDPSNTAFMTNRFRDANLFMPRSDGDQVATFAEVHELIFAIMSGMRLHNSLRPSLIKECPRSTSNPRGKSIERVDYGCLYENYKRGFRTYFTSMPDFQRFQKAIPEPGFAAFFFNSLKAAGYIPRGSGVKTSDVALLPQLIQYQELFFARFDTNADGVITVPEAKRAFPAFKEILKLVAKSELESGTISESDLPAVFMWVLKYGKPPETIWEKLKFLGWMKDPSQWDCSADRSMIASILGYISDQLAVKP